MDTNDPYQRCIADQGGATILDIQHGVISTLNPLGAHIWSALHRGDAVEVIISEIVRSTGEATSTVEVDVRAFIESLSLHCLMPVSSGVRHV
jgi:hypothetical protein